MKKLKKYILTIVLVSVTFCAISVSAYAAEPDELLSDFSAVIPDKYKDILASPDSISEEISYASLRDLLAEELSNAVPSAVKLLLFTLGVCMLATLAEIYKSRLGGAVNFAVSCVVISALASQCLSLFMSVSSALTEASDFFSAVVPVLCALNASGGGTATASTQGVGMSVTVSLCTTVVSEILPFVAAVVYSLEILSLLGSECKIGASAKNLYMKILGILTLVISLFMTFQSALASAADTAAIRTAKYGAANLIPIVGSTVSASIGLLSGGLAYVKSIAGVGAVVVLLHIFLAPLILLLLYRLVLSFCASLEASLRSSGGGLLSPALGLLDCMIASYSLCAVLYIFEIILFMKYGLVL